VALARWRMRFIEHGYRRPAAIRKGKLGFLNLRFL
jgi:hypothetical protein